MKLKLITCFFIALAILPFNTEAKNFITLKECFELALAQSESLAIDEQDIKIAEAHFKEALSTALPQLSFNGQAFYQENVGGTAYSRSNAKVLNFNVTQPLFRGFRELFALKAAKAEKNEYAYAYQRAREVLFFDVTETYYRVLEAEHELSILNSILSTLQKRSGDLKKWIELGRSRESEWLNNETEIASLIANIEAQKGLVATTRDLLSFYIGKPATQKLVDEYSIPAKLPSLETWYGFIKNRPDIKSLEEAVKKQKNTLNYTKSKIFPSVDFEGNYYPYRSGFQNDISWDATFNLSLPLFTGGYLKSQTQLAKAQSKQADLLLQESTRRAKLEVAQAYHNLTSTINQSAALKKAVNLSEKNYLSLSDEYSRKLVTNIEVLSGLQTWQTKRVESNQAFYTAKLYYLHLLLTSSQLPDYVNEKL